MHSLIILQRISSVTENDILYAGHTKDVFDEHLSSKMEKNGETVIIVMMNDYIVYSNDYMIEKSLMPEKKNCNTVALMY